MRQRAMEKGWLPKNAPGLTPEQVEANYAKVTPIRRVLQPDRMVTVIVGAKP